MQSFNFKIGINFQFIEVGMNVYEEVDFKQSPHLLISGGSGSGKTYASIGILARICKNYQVHLIVCDFKADEDFRFLEGLPFCYMFDEVVIGINYVHEQLKLRQKQKISKDIPIILFFDEYNSYIIGLDKKEADEVKKKMQQILNMGRSFNIFVIVAVQRADAKVFDTARDNFGNKLGLGTLSNESARMLFPHDTNEIEKCSRGQGYLSVEGKELKKIVIPTMKSIRNAQRVIHECMRSIEEVDSDCRTDEV